MTAAELAQQIGVSEEAVNGAAESCARRLAEWFGSAEAAADALRGSPVEMVGIALADHVKATKKMTVAAHKNPGRVAEAVLGMVTGQAAHKEKAMTAAVYPADLPAESRAIYDRVLERIGDQWAPLARAEGATAADHADHCHWADNLSEWGLIERRVIYERRSNGTVGKGVVEYRRAAR